MEADSFFPSEFTNYEYIYNNENSIAQLQVPLAISYFNVPKFANELYTDTDATYFTYSGDWSSLIVSREKDGRYKNLSMRAYSGDSFKFYFSTGLGFSSGANYYSGPLTTSGVYSKLTMYSGETAAITNAITFTAPTDNSSVYTLPFIENINWIRLHHKEAASGQAYRLYQFLPRTLIQVDDLEADVIDAVTIRVSDSIVIGPNLIGDKTILGQKIVDGTLSGILLTDGTITGTKVQARTISGILITAGTIKGENIEAATISGALITAGTITAVNISGGTITGDKIQVGTVSGVLITNSGITANKLNISQLDAVAANMGTLIVNSGISVGTNGYITVPSGYISAGKAKLDSTGLQIGTVSSSNLPSITDTLRVAGSGVAGNIVGMALYNGAFSATNPQAVLQLDSTNALELEMRAVSGIVNINFPEQTTTGQFFQVYNADMYLRRSPNPPANIPGGSIYGLDSDDTLRYYIGADQLLLNNNTTNTFTVDSSTGDIVTAGSLYAAGPITTDFTIDANGQIVSQYGIKANTQLDVGFDGVGAYNFNVGSAGDVTTNGKLSLSNGSVTDPSLTFNSDPNTGFYWSGADLIRVSTGGVQSAIFAADRFLISNGAVSSPGLQFISDQNTGIYSVSADVLGIATGGAQRASISTTTANFTGKITSDQMGYLTVRRTTDVAITTAGTTITWQSIVRNNNISVATDTITIDNAGYYMFSATFATVANLTSLRMTLARGAVNYVSTLHGAGLSTGGGYIFNFSIGFWATAGSTYKVNLIPSANTTLNANVEGGSGPSPIMNIFQAIGV